MLDIYKFLRIKMEKNIYLQEMTGAYPILMIMVKHGKILMVKDLR